MRARTSCTAALLVAVLVAACSSAPDPTTTTTAATTTTPATTTTAPPTTTTAGVEDDLFTDPQGMYQIRVDPAWVPNHGALIAEVELWFVAEAEAGFAPNVNVITQQAGVSDMDAYIDLSIESAPLVIDDFELVAAEIVDADGLELGVIEYTGTTSGFDLSFFAVFALDGELALIATFSAPPASYDELVAEVEPYLLTLRPAP